MIMPSGSLAVLALNCLTKSMMFTPCGPRAVPTGGAGVAFPAGICSLTCPVTFFAILCLCLFYLQEIELDGRGAAKNGDQHAERVAFGIDFIDLAREVGERSIDDPDILVLLEVHLGPRTIRRGLLAVKDCVHFIGGQGHGMSSAANEAGDARRGLDGVPHFVVHIELDEHVAGVYK